MLGFFAMGILDIGKIATITVIICQLFLVSKKGPLLPKEQPRHHIIQMMRSDYRYSATGSKITSRAGGISRLLTSVVDRGASDQAAEVRILNHGHATRKNLSSFSLTNVKSGG